MNSNIKNLLPIDHIIFYAGFNLPELAFFFERIGFTVTPLGKHATGSINRLVVLEGNYIELIGFEPGTPHTVRPELQACEPGLNGIAFRGVPKPEWSADRLAKFNPTYDLHRPVDTEVVFGTARFYITTLVNSLPNFRVFLCEHQTPNLIWHPSWMQHPNAVNQISEIRVFNKSPQQFWDGINIIGSIGSNVQNSQVLINHIQIDMCQESEPSSLTLCTKNLDKLKQILKESSIEYLNDDSGAIEVFLPRMNKTQLKFIQK